MRFGVLGPVIVDGTDAGRVAIPQPKRRAVLALLAANAGRPISVARLVDGVWGEHPPPTAAKNVHVHVCQLRKLTGARLHSDNGGYRLEPAADDVIDAVEFTRRIRRARAAGDPGHAAREYREALSWWRGDAMSDLVDIGLLQPEAHALDDQRRTVVAEWLEIELVSGIGTGLVAQLIDLVDRFPVEEPLREALMIALDREGRPTEALAAFADAAEVLVARGSAPGERLRAIASSIRRERFSRAVRSSPPAVAVAHGGGRPDSWDAARVRQLPPDLCDFVDRTEVGYILDVARVGDGPARVVCIGGVAGAGKTTLAIHVAHRLRPHFPDGQLFATLRSATGEPVPVDTVVGRFLRALGVAAADVPTDAEEASALYRSLVADRDMLVVLDDVEREEQVRPLRPTGPGSLTLITGRRGLPGLPGARPVWLGAMPAAESRRLLRHVVGAERVDREPEATTALLEACGHLPLAVRAAGVRLATRPGWRIADLPTTPDALWEQLSTGDIDVRAALAAVRADPSDSGRGLPKRS